MCVAIGLAFSIFHINQIGKMGGLERIEPLQSPFGNLGIMSFLGNFGSIANQNRRFADVNIGFQSDQTVRKRT